MPRIMLFTFARILTTRDSGVAVKQSIEMTVGELRADHRNMVLLLDLLDSETQRMAELSDADYELVREILSYMMEYSDVVHHPKEDLLYGYLKTRYADIDDSLEKIEADHAALAATTSKICGAIPAQPARSTAELQSLTSAMVAYSRELRNHMFWEEKTLFSLADETADDGGWATMLGGHDLPDDPLFGRKVRKRFRKLFNHIQRRMVWDVQQYFT